MQKISIAIFQFEVTYLKVEKLKFLQTILQEMKIMEQLLIQEMFLQEQLKVHIKHGTVILRDTTIFNASSVNFDEVYTDNPVWIFYDLLTNTNYGLGQFIDADQIDKYELFRLAKFCDEEVDDGEVEQNLDLPVVYITQSTEATNLIKQLASVFRGMAIWMDGQITAISIDAKSSLYLYKSKRKRWCILI